MSVLYSTFIQLHGGFMKLNLDLTSESNFSVLAARDHYHFSSPIPKLNNRV